MISKPRVRFAPSPTGELHVGNARTALFNWLFARHFQGDLILRIEDTDEARSALSYQERLVNDLRWLGLDWDEGPSTGGAHGPYRQSERLDIYADHLKKLVEADLVYPCFCTGEELEEERQALILSKRMPRYMGKCRHLSCEERQARALEGRKPSYRFKVPNETVLFDDLIRGPMKFEGDAMGDFIIVRSNGMPAYNFAVVIDDHLMQITHVIRGEDHLSNTALQIMLYRAFGFEPPVYAHHCLILGKDHAKLSKRHGAVSVGEFRRQGFLPEALVNYLGLLGSSFAEGREVLTAREMVDAFSLDRASKSGAIFDEEKLRWLNALYIRDCEASALLTRLRPFLLEAGYPSETIDPVWLAQVVETVKTDLTTLADIGGHVALFLDERLTLSPEAEAVLNPPEARQVVEAFEQYLARAQGDPQDIYAGAIKHVKTTLGAKGKALFMPVRAALTGRISGPELDRVFVVLGKDVARRRLQLSCEMMENK
ncbi:MAG: glutamate--tRNA ligase, partial [Smithellaceae bacterium]